MVFAAKHPGARPDRALGRVARTGSGGRLEDVIQRFLITALSLAAAVWLVPGIAIGAMSGSSLVTLAVVAIVFGILNSFVKPIAQVVTLPVILLTLGLFLWVINAGMLLLTSWVAGLLNLPFRVSGWGPALVGALIITIVTAIANKLFGSEPERR